MRLLAFFTLFIVGSVVGAAELRFTFVPAESGKEALWFGRVHTPQGKSFSSGPIALKTPGGPAATLVISPACVGPYAILFVTESGGPSALGHCVVVNSTTGEEYTFSSAKSVAAGQREVFVYYYRNELGEP